MAPATVPHSAMATVSPRDPGDRWYVLLRSAVVPAMTAVSNPNKRPPSAATTVLRIRYLFRVTEWCPPADSPRWPDGDSGLVAMEMLESRNLDISESSCPLIYEKAPSTNRQIVQTKAHG